MKEENYFLIMVIIGIGNEFFKGRVNAEKLELPYTG